MGLEDFLISTGVDGLINLVHKKGKIEMVDAAKELGLPVSTVEDWAKTLEAEGLIRIEYNITKEFLIWASLSPQKYTQKKGEISKSRQEATSKLENLKKSVDQNLEELEKTRDEFEGRKTEVESQLDVLSEDVKQASQLAAQAKEIIEQKKVALRELEGQLSHARKELYEFEEVLKRSPAKEGGGEDAKKLMEKLEKISNSLETKVKDSSTRFNEITTKVEAIREDLETDTTSGQLASVKSELEEIKFARNELVKSAKALLEEAGAMGKRQKLLSDKVETIEQVRGQKVDSKKLKEEIESTYSGAMKASKEVMDEMQNNLMVVRKQIQDYSQAAYKYQSLNANLQNVQNRYSQESGQLSELLHNLDEAGAKYDADLNVARETLGSNKEEFEKLLNKAKQIDLMLSNIRDLQIEGKKLATTLKGLVMEANVVDMAAPEGVKKGAPVYMPAADVKRKLEGKVAAAISGAANSVGEVSADIAQRITLTEAEEKDFEKKREELRWLIHKMWEDDRSSSSDI